MNSLAQLPGGVLVAQGIEDCKAGRITAAACLVAAGAPRLRRAGLALSGAESRLIPEPEKQLYEILTNEGGDAYSRYNSLIRQLISCEQSMEQEKARQESRA